VLGQAAHHEGQDGERQCQGQPGAEPADLRIERLGQEPGRQAQPEQEPEGGRAQRTFAPTASIMLPMTPAPTIARVNKS